ncbi:hypothetical protein FACS189449_12650 [Alphaproteobacteria bacterium]|nr:hypothetical protein FACS189449_12650 [Alphaproteobacteria bacterium]
MEIPEKYKFMFCFECYSEGPARVVFVTAKNDGSPEEFLFGTANTGYWHGQRIIKPFNFQENFIAQAAGGYSLGSFTDEMYAGKREFAPLWKLRIKAEEACGEFTYSKDSDQCDIRPIEPYRLCRDFPLEAFLNFWKDCASRMQLPNFPAWCKWDLHLNTHLCFSWRNLQLKSAIIEPSTFVFFEK